MKYMVKYRYDRGEWNQIEVSGHRFDKDTDRMEFFKPDGGVLALGQWSKYDIELGIDWAEIVKKHENK